MKAGGRFEVKVQLITEREERGNPRKPGSRLHTA